MRCQRGLCIYLFCLLCLLENIGAEGGENVGRCFATVTQCLGELCHSKLSLKAYLLIYLCLLDLGIIDSYERNQWKMCNVVPGSGETAYLEF